MAAEEDESPRRVEEAADGGEEEEEVSKKRELETLKLAGLEFAEREALWRHCQEIQTRLDGATEGFAQGADAFFLCALLAQHPNAHEKMSPGVTAFGYGVNSEFPDTKSFFAMRVDGSRAAFSARKCVDSLFPGGPDAPPLLLAPFSKRHKPAHDSEPGSIVVVTGLQGQAVSYAEIKEVLNRFAPVRYVDIDEDLGTATVRFDSAAGASLAVNECADINGCKAVLAVATPEQAAKLRQDFDHSASGRHQHRSSNRSGRGAGRSRGRSGRSRGRPIGRGIRGRSLAAR